ncbi:hypothetical protein O95_00371 [Bartonella henselae JK 53]|nr:hypothetical protein O95_00371 [Bartonella henselae JK 53]
MKRKMVLWQSDATPGDGTAVRSKSENHNENHNNVRQKWNLKQYL